MLTDDQILYLLAQCELQAGRILPQLRGNLQTDNWLSAVWELLVADASSRLGIVSYEEPTEGSSRPDFLFAATSGERVHFEAAFAFAEDERGAIDARAHPVSKILRRKARQARDAASRHPFVVFLASDRVFSLDHLRAYRRNTGHAVYSLFENSATISAAVVVPILLRPQTFTGFARELRPALFVNPNARNVLSEEMRSTIHRLDFFRWKLALWTQEQRVRPSLRARLRAASGRPLGTSDVSSSVAPEPEPFVGQPSWSYTWNFHCLRIGGIQGLYWLYDNREPIGHYQSPEQAARSASYLFQPVPSLVISESGIVRTSDHSVPDDLREWILHR